jgi:hypothetical protein
VLDIVESYWLDCHSLLPRCSAFCCATNLVCSQQGTVFKSFLDPESTVPNQLSETKWKAHTKATSAIAKSYNWIIVALTSIHTNEIEGGDKEERLILEELEFVLMLELCNSLLDQFYKSSKALQDPQIGLSTYTKLTHSSIICERNPIKIW